MVRRSVECQSTWCGFASSGGLDGRLVVGRASRESPDRPISPGAPASTQHRYAPATDAAREDERDRRVSRHCSRRPLGDPPSADSSRAE